MEKNVKSHLEKFKQSGFSNMSRSEMVKSFELYSSQIAQALPASIRPERIIQMAVDVMEKNPKLKECTPQSVIGALMQASVLGFRPASSLGECYFVPYGKDCQLQIGYRGWISLARRNKYVKTPIAFCVYANEDFEMQYGTSPKIHHIPARNPSLRGELIGVYAILEFMDGGKVFCYLDKSEVEALRLRNPMQRSSPSGAWATDYEEMAMGKAIKKLKKYIGIDVEDEVVITPDSFAKDQSGTITSYDYSAAKDIEPEPTEAPAPDTHNTL